MSSESSSESAKTGAEAFLSSLEEATKQPGPSPDSKMSVAFALGWQMSELYQPAKWPRQPPKHGDDLPGLSKLSDVQRAMIGLSQVDVALSRLKPAITEHGLASPTTADARNSLIGKPTDEQFRNAIFDLHVLLLTTLTAANVKLGKAYGLGRALADTTHQPTDIESLKTQLESHRVANLRAWLDDLTSVLPAHAAHAVKESLILWRDWASASAPKTNRGEDVPRIVRLLRRQGERWRALLSGEKQGIDMLDLQDYVAAGSDFLRRLGGLTLRFVYRFSLLLLLAAALFGAGVWVILHNSSSGHIAAGLGGVLTSVGLTWKGVGGSLGKTIGKLEQPVWQASLDSEIAHAITRLPGSRQAKGYTAPSTGEEGR